LKAITVSTFRTASSTLAMLGSGLTGIRLTRVS
jgi:hypothetical protein